MTDILSMLDNMESGEGKASTGFSLEVKASICFQRWYRNVPVKTIAAGINRTHSRVTEIAAGRDYKSMKPATQAEFARLVQAKFATVGKKYTGDYMKSHSWVDLPKVK